MTRALRISSPYQRLYNTVAVVINTTARGEIRSWITHIHRIQSLITRDQKN